MPRPRDQRLYFELQGKLTQEEINYSNMHQHHMIMKGVHGKTSKIDNDAASFDFEPIAKVRSSLVKDFIPSKSEYNATASEPLQNDGSIIPHKTATKMRMNNLPALPNEPPRVNVDMEVEQAKEKLFRFVAERTRSKTKIVKKLNVEKDRLAEQALNLEKVKTRTKQEKSRDARQKRIDRRRNRREAATAASRRIAESKESQIYSETGHSIHKRAGISVDKMDFK